MLELLSYLQVDFGKILLFLAADGCN